MPVPARNRIGNVALALVIIALVLPVVGFVVGFAWSLAEGAQGDEVGWGILGGLVIGAVAGGGGSLLALAGIVLGIVGLTRTGRRKLTSGLAVGLGVPPALGVLALPAFIDTVF